jgi:hypothetical protein
MKTNAKPPLLIVVIAVSMIALSLRAQTPEVQNTANPVLVGAVAKEIGATPTQAEGATGALFGLAKSRLAPADWSKVASAVPGMDTLLSAAPSAAVGTGGSAGLSATQNAMLSEGGLASLAGSFNKLGLKPEMAAKAVPVLTNYVSKMGGADVGKILAGALK